MLSGRSVSTSGARCHRTGSAYGSWTRRCSSSSRHRRRTSRASSSAASASAPGIRRRSGKDGGIGSSDMPVGVSVDVSAEVSAVLVRMSGRMYGRMFRWMSRRVVPRPVWNATRDPDSAPAPFSPGPPPAPGGLPARPPGRPPPGAPFPAGDRRTCCSPAGGWCGRSASPAPPTPPVSAPTRRAVGVTASRADPPLRHPLCLRVRPAASLPRRPVTCGRCRVLSGGRPGQQHRWCPGSSPAEAREESAWCFATGAGSAITRRRG